MFFHGNIIVQNSKAILLQYRLNDTEDALDKNHVLFEFLWPLKLLITKNLANVSLYVTVLDEDFCIRDWI